MFVRHFAVAFALSWAASATHLLQHHRHGVQSRDEPHPAFGLKDRAAKLSATRKDIAEQLARMQAGGQQAVLPLTRLTTLASEPDSKQIMRVLGVEASAVRLMQSPASDDRLQRLAGSIITLLSGMPVSSEIAEERSGSHGQVHIVVPRPSRIYGPDQLILDLNAGVRPSRIA